MYKYKAAIFDFDGTIADSGEGVINSVIYALKKYGIAENDREKLRYFIGPPLFDSFRDMYGVSDSDADRLIAYYRERYNVEGYLETRLYDGIQALLQKLRACGVKTAICSSKPEVFVEKISENLGILPYLDHISAVTFRDKNADKTPLLQKALRLCGIEDPRAAVMVGDRYFDTRAAAGLGVTAVGVTYGFGTREELQENGADYIADNTAQLETILLEQIKSEGFL